MSSAVRTMNDVVECVSDFYSVTKREVLGSNRSREFMVPRQISMWFCKKKLRHPYKKIGDFFGGRDHSSVINSVNRIDKLRKTDKELWRNVNNLRRDMGF